MIRITPTSPTRGPARLRDHVWGGPGWDRAVHQRADGGEWLVCSRVDGDTRVLRHWRRAGRALVALDETRFRLAPDFAEVERRYARAQANQHVAPVALPARLGVGEPVAPLPGVVVTLDWHGWAVFEVGGATEHRPAIAIGVEAGGQRRVQWLVAGVGEVALGEGEGRWERWLTAWSGGGGHLFAAAPDVDPDSLPDLPETAPPRPTGVF